MNTQAKIFVVDDDEAVRDSLTILLEAAGYAVAAFSGPEDFLNLCPPNCEGCIILNVNMLTLDGTTLQEELMRGTIHLPVIILSGCGSIPLAVQTIKAGAIDFLSKPVDSSVLLACVQGALEQCSLMHKQAEEYQSISSRLATLTEREREVMQLVVAGHTCKEIAQSLSISFRTVEVHRAHIMQKTGAFNLLELAHIAMKLESFQSPH